MSYLLASLHRPSREYKPHSTSELANCALPYIERSPVEWTSKQKAAFEYLNRFFVDDAEYLKLEQQLATRSGPTQGIEIIVKIGDLFLLEGLAGVGFEWQSNPHPRDNKVAAEMTETRIHLGTLEVITFYAGHHGFRTDNVAARRRWLFGRLFHEAVHALFFRYVAGHTFTGHHFGFNLAAEAIEREASSLFEVDFDLNRENSFMRECKKSGRVDMTQLQLDKCFPGKYNYAALSHNLNKRKEDQLDFGGQHVKPEPQDL